MKWGFVHSYFCISIKLLNFLCWVKLSIMKIQLENCISEFLDISASLPRHASCVFIFTRLWFAYSYVCIYTDRYMLLLWYCCSTGSFYTLWNKHLFFKGVHCCRSLSKCCLLQSVFWITEIPAGIAVQTLLPVSVMRITSRFWGKDWHSRGLPTFFARQEDCCGDTCQLLKTMNRDNWRGNKRLPHNSAGIYWALNQFLRWSQWHCMEKKPVQTLCLNIFRQSR